MKKTICLVLLTSLPMISLAQAPTLVHGGQNAAEVTRVSATGDSALDRDEPTSYRLSVTPGNSISLSFWARSGTSASPSSFQRVTFAFFDSAGAFLSTPGDINYEVGTVLNTAWTQYTETPVTVPAGAAKMNVAFRPAGNSVIVLDDISVKDVTAGNTELLSNGGFEDWPGAETTHPTSWRHFAVATATGGIKRLQVPVTAADPQWNRVK